MARAAETPESLMAHSAPKSPDSTCQGITTNGRRCRRRIAKDETLGAQFDVIHDSRNNFCYQHKDQAGRQQPESNKQKDRNGSLHKKSSLDTLVDRLGIMNLTGSSSSRPDNVTRGSKGRTTKQERRPKKKRGFFARLCCSGYDANDDDYLEIVRHSKRQQSTAKSKFTATNQEKQRHTHVTQQNASSKTDATVPAKFQKFIPRSLPVEIKALLVAELSKPISTHDEDGYIYVYKIDEHPADDSNLSKFVKDSSLRDSNVPRSGSRALAKGSPDRGANNGTEGRQTVLVKVGRATNVHRRLQSWSKQCGYNLSLLRFYPYHSTRPAPDLDVTRVSDFELPPASATSVKKVPHSHRVERLIHIELGRSQVKQIACGACGRAHREWFEIPSTRDGIRNLDEVIKRWVNWAESVDVA